MPRFLAPTAAALMVCTLSLYSPTLRAQAHPTYTASIPFEFQVDHKVMSAGTYEIDPLTPHRMRLRHLGTPQTADLLVFPIDEPGTVPSGKLRFARYGTVYFLHEFSAPTEHTGPHSASRCIPTGEEKQAVRNLNSIASEKRQSPTEVAVSATPHP